MSMAFLYGNDGNGSLNFNVSTYANEENLPIFAHNNSIAIITDIPMSTYIFSPVRPELDDALYGMVWIKTGVSEYNKFNVLLSKKNYISICPQYAEQYQGDGIWIDKVMKIYQDGSWNNLWDGKLYMHGNEYTLVTDGWTTQGLVPTVGSTAHIVAFVERHNESNLYLDVTTQTEGRLTSTFLTPRVIIDVTKFSQLTFKGSFKRSNSTANSIIIAGCWAPQDTNYYVDSGVVFAKLGSTTASQLTVDISKIQGYYTVGVGVTDGIVNIKECYLS